MPRRGEWWDWNAAKGNPTKSPAITKLIERVETAENKSHVSFYTKEDALKIYGVYAYYYWHLI